MQNAKWINAFSWAVVFLTSQLLAQELPKKSAQEPLQNSAQETLQNSAQETLQNSAQETLQNSAQETLQNSAQELPQKSAQELPKNSAQETLQNSAQELPREVMSEKYWSFWNETAQKKIDADIEKNRKADAVLTLENVQPGTEIYVEQKTHDFKFGANMFLFGQLGTDEKNKAYADAFGELFNAGTVAFYWKTLEPTEGKIRFAADSEYSYRRPPTDPVVEYCESRGLDIHGHAMIYGIRRWGHPDWLPTDRKAMEPLFERHIRQIAEHYGSRIHEWDVVNECIDQANRGPMPDDYVYKTF